IPESLPDTSFRPLTDWVDYVLHHERTALTEWVQAATFDFEPFVCKEGDGEEKAKKEQATKRARRHDSPPSPSPPKALPAITKGKKPPAPLVEALPRLPELTPSELRKELQALEQHFLGLDGPLDSPERQALWPQLARVNGALGQTSDAALCWLQGLWPDTPEAGALARDWSGSESGSDNG